MNPVDDEVLALTAIVRPILTGALFALKREVVAEVGGYEQVCLFMLPRLYRAGDGDCGICFEYAVHDAMNRGDPLVLERINDAVRLCNVPGTAPKSLLFGLEKTGNRQMIAAVEDALTDESRLLAGKRGQPVKLKRHLSAIAGAFRNRRTRPSLPTSIRGLWKADLFVGHSDTDRWVATSVKINPNNLEGAAGLRIGIVPNRQGRNDLVRRDDMRNLVICPLNHDQDFMQAFYEGWRIVQAFIEADARMPNEATLPRPAHREVVRILQERRDFPVLDVVAAIAAFGQPELIETQEGIVDLQALRGEAATDMVVAPMARPANRA